MRHERSDSNNGVVLPYGFFTLGGNLIARFFSICVCDTKTHMIWECSNFLWLETFLWILLFLWSEHDLLFTKSSVTTTRLQPYDVDPTIR